MANTWNGYEVVDDEPIEEAANANTWEGFEIIEEPEQPAPVAAAPAVVEPVSPEKPESTWLERGADIGIDLAKGAVQSGQAVVGLGSLASGGLLSKGMDALGYKPEEAQKYLSDMYSPARQAEEKEYEESEGFVGGVEALVTNPVMVGGKVVETAPMMLNSIAAARSFAGAAFKSAFDAAIKGGATKAAAQKVALEASSKAATRAAAASEGAQQAGMSFDGYMNEGMELGRAYVASIGSGITTALGAWGGGILGKKFGFGDVEAGVGATTKEGISKLREAGTKFVKGGVQEGLFEELGQSATEQMWDNYANEKPLMEGVPKAAGTGLVVGAAAGGGFSVFQGGEKTPSEKTKETIEELSPDLAILGGEDLDASASMDAIKAATVGVNAYPDVTTEVDVGGIIESAMPQYTPEQQQVAQQNIDIIDEARGVPTVEEYVEQTQRPPDDGPGPGGGGAGVAIAEPAVEEPIGIDADGAPIYADIAEGKSPEFDIGQEKPAAKLDVGQEKPVKSVSEALPVERPEIQVKRGKAQEVVSSAGNTTKTEYAVVEADDLIASNDTAGNKNKLYPDELQPRDRSRDASKLQVSKMANKLRPELLGLGVKAAGGSPIIGKDGVVESGNGRTIAMKMAYEQGKAAEYRAYMEEHAEEFGLAKDDFTGMKNPVLVRVRADDADMQARANFTREANQAGVAPMTAMEQATSDADLISDEDMNLYSPDTGGNVLAASNQGFLQRFAKKIGDLAAGGLSTGDGRWTKQMADRVQAAVFHKAYGDDRLLGLMAEEADADIKTILNALNTAAPAFARARSYGELGDLNVIDDIVAATDLIRQAKASKMSVADIIAQDDMFGSMDPVVAQIAQFISDNTRSAKRMGIAFNEMAQFAEVEMQNRSQPSLMEMDQVTKSDVITAAQKRLKEVYGEETAIQDLFSQVEPASCERDAGPGLSRREQSESAGAKTETATTENWTGTINGQEAEVNINPSEEQRESGNYQKAHITVQGMRVSIETPAGIKRNPKWPAMAAHYGYIRDTIGADSETGAAPHEIEQVDISVNPDVETIPDSNPIYIINQYIDGKFDEVKVQAGFTSKAAAEKSYMAGYTKGWKGLNSTHKLSIDEFKAWLDTGEMTAEYHPVKNNGQAYTEFDGLDITYQVEVEETGETVEVEVDAGEALRAVDKRIDSLEELRKCVL